MDRKRVSVVVSVYNEEKALGEFYAETLRCFWGWIGTMSWSLSTTAAGDGSLEILRSWQGKTTGSSWSAFPAISATKRR